MRYHLVIFMMVMIASSIIVQGADADTRYVGDQLVITLRQGKSTEYKILKTLKTGTPVELLQEDGAYLKVRTSDGLEGYVLRQYMTSDPPKTELIGELEKENSSLRKKINDLQSSNTNLEVKLKSIQEKYDRDFSEIAAKSADIEQSLEQALNNERITQEKYNTLLAQAENVVEIASERDQLLQKNKKMAAEVSDLLSKNEKMGDSRIIKWFLAGGGVFLCGWIVGKISRKKRSRF